MKKTASIRKLRLRNSSRLNGDVLDNKQLPAALMAFKRGDFTARLPDDWIGLGGKIADAFNEVIDTNQRMARELDRLSRVVGKQGKIARTVNTMGEQLGSFASEVTRLAREVGTEGKLGGQAKVKGVAGTWKDLTDNVNFMAGSLTSQVRDIAAVTTAVASGDLSKKISVEVKGEILE